MFNSYITKTDHVPYTKTVIENRAPTDDSIRLYGEMLDKARKNIVAEFNLDSNVINCHCTAFEDKARYTGIAMMYKVVINDRDIHGEFRISKDDMVRERVPARMLIERLSKHVADTVMGDMLEMFGKMKP